MSFSHSSHVALQRRVACPRLRGHVLQPLKNLAASADLRGPATGRDCTCREAEHRHATLGR